MVADTVVMDNLGYFQLQAQPGVRDKGCTGLDGRVVMLGGGGAYVSILLLEESKPRSSIPTQKVRQ